MDESLSRWLTGSVWASENSVRWEWDNCISDINRAVFSWWKLGCTVTSRVLIEAITASTRARKCIVLDLVGALAVPECLCPLVRTIVWLTSSLGRACYMHEQRIETKLNLQNTGKFTKHNCLSHIKTCQKLIIYGGKVALTFCTDESIKTLMNRYRKLHSYPADLWPHQLARL